MISQARGTPVPDLKTTVGTGPVAVTHHDLATRAALEVMEAGGNAVDAAVAANAVVGVVLPTACGPGGDLFAVVHDRDVDRPHALNASGRAGSGADPDRLRRRYARVPYRGPDSITVPGCVDGWEALLQRFGSLSLRSALEPAIRTAEEGFGVSTELAGALEAIRPIVGSEPSAAPLYPSGSAPKAGMVIRRPDLAGTLRELAEGGRGALYEGEVGREITRVTNGTITASDLHRSSAEWVDPLGCSLFGRTAWTVPPNSQGYLTLAALWLAENLDLPSDFEDPVYSHLLVEAYRAVAWERDDLVSDPDTAPLAPARLIDSERLRPRLDSIRRDALGVWPVASELPGGTTYLGVVDRAGLGVSLIQSNFGGIGSGVSAGATGVFLQNRGAGFNLLPGHPNEMRPGRRPLHTLSPTLWTRNGRLELLLGTRGGHWQPQLLIQMSAHLFHLLDEPGIAQERPRWVLEGFGPGDRPRLKVERRMPDGVIDGLAEKGLSVEKVGGRQSGWGPVSLILVGTDETRKAAAEPRIDTATARAL